MNDNPNWKTLLDTVPAEYHPLMKPVLEAWDTGVSQKINELHETYKPFKPFVDNKVSPQIIDQALDVYGQLSNDPAAFVKRVDEVMDLKLFTPQQTQQVTNDTGDLGIGDEFEGVDITKHPVVKTLLEQVTTLQNNWDKQTQETQQEKQVREFNEFLDTLEEEYKDKGGINRHFITAVMSQGVSADDAVKQYQDLIANSVSNDPNVQNQLNNQNGQQGQGDSSSNNTATPPNVMGSSGTAGGGLPGEAINPATLDSVSLDAMVAEMLKKDAEGG